MSISLTDADVVRATDLCKRYGKKQALDGLTLSLAPTGITAVLGANGAGKTTLIRCVLGLTRATSGELSVFGGPPGSHASRRRTGAMLQDADLPDLLTGREHLTLFASYYPRPMTVERAIEVCELEDFADKRYKALSGGQKRRIQFALAVIGQPDLLFLDEPASGLDGDARRALWRTVRKLAHAGTSIVLTTHYLEEADALADRIVVLRDGRVLADAPTAEMRTAVGGALIRCVTAVTVDLATGLAAARSAQQNGRFLEIMTADAPRTLSALFQHDPAPGDLTVSKPSLEDAVADLNHLDSQVAT